jgi:two-component system chemotaxis response regulator CheB
MGEKIMSRIRALIVDDSITVRKRLVEILGSDAEIEVVGEASNGKVAVEACTALNPDVITMDMAMPLMNGLEATEQIMALRPTPILIISSSTNRGELFKTYDALAAGAVDVLEKMVGREDHNWEQKLIAQLKLVSRIRVITHPRARLRNVQLGHRQLGASQLGSSKPGFQPRCVAIGASTGGPQALAEIFRSLPSTFPISILLVIHIGYPFDTSFSEWLDSQSPIRVSVAKEGDLVYPVDRARVLMAPPDSHMEVVEGRIRLTSAPERHSCRPSVDVLFESLARGMGPNVIACLLTGMGKDGAAGSLAIKSAGGITLVQDESTSMIFGMPREAIAMDAASQVLPLGEFAPTLISLVSTTTTPKLCHNHATATKDKKL